MLGVYGVCWGYIECVRGAWVCWGCTECVEGALSASRVHKQCVELDNG